MFCPKCGTKAPDGAGFCQKCGAKLITDVQEPTSASPAQQPSSTGKAPKKKKSKKLPIIIGAIVLLVAIIAIISSGGGGGARDNIATVKAHKPFATSQNLPYTFAEVFDKYTDNPVWHTDSEDEKANTAIVKVDGTLKGTEYRLIVSIEVSPNPNDPDGCLIRPQTVTFDGTESPSQNDAVEFLYGMFAAYDQGYEDLSGLLSDSGPFGQQENIELTEVYTNADAGISFRYPANWVITEESDLKIVDMIASDNAAGHRVWLQVNDILDTDPLNVFSGDAASIETAVNEFHTFLSVEDSTISGLPVRMLKYRTEGLGGSEIVQSYYYTNGASRYLVQCTYSESIADTYEKVFDAIIDSYTITPIEGVAPSQGEPSDQPSTATTSDTVFETDYYTLTIPANWDGKYTYEQDGSNLTFYELESYNDGWGGKLFGISLREDEEFLDFPGYYSMGALVELNDGLAPGFLYYVVVSTPTDVQFSDDAAETYTEMNNSIDSILASISAKSGYAIITD